MQTVPVCGYGATPPRTGWSGEVTVLDCRRRVFYLGVAAVAAAYMHVPTGNL